MEILKISREVRRTGRSAGTVISVHPNTVRVNVHMKYYSFSSVFFGCIRKIGKKSTISFVMYVCLSVRPHETYRLPQEEFPRNLIFEYYSNIWEKIQFH